MLEHKITKEDGSQIILSNSRNNNPFWLLYNDDKQKFKFTPTEDLNCELFMIGGGGAGGYFFGGGGGAGAAYINNNYTFKKNKTYTFEVGTGGTCDIADINKLFKSGLNLNIYNNTNVNLTNVNFVYDDYSSLGVENSGMMQSFNVNNITIPASILHNNTTYIWDGYIKTNTTGYFNITINSKLKTMIWVDKFVYNNANVLIEGNNLNDVKIVQLESNRYYNIKIIVYNDANSSNNFNITFEGCQFFNFDKKEEKYIYIPASDSVLTYRNDDNTFETIRCKGGGNGGCGFYNKNTNLDGGCGGGSGINKIKGTSIIGPVYNGNDGAVGDYCGGGGGIISSGINNIGGNGKIINWFNETLIFGAGGNAANLNETRNLGYGCGGNGGECCYYSKLLINNNGNNGCILIYVKSPNNSSPAPKITEGFSNKATIMLPDNSIAKKLIEKSFAFPPQPYTTTEPTRSSFFQKPTDDVPYLRLIANLASGGTTTYNCLNGNKNDTSLNQTFIYDMLVISKLYAIIYRLYWYQFNEVFNGDLVRWKDFCSNARIKFTSTNVDNATRIDGYDVYINNLFDISNLNLTTTTTLAAYNGILYTSSAGTAMNAALISKYCNYYKAAANDASPQNTAYVPLYHKYDNGAAFNNLSAFYTNEISNNKYYKINIGDIEAAGSETIITTAPTYNASDPCSIDTAGSITLNMKDSSSFVTRANLTIYYNALIANASYNDPDNYLKQRAYVYFEALNEIFNTDSTYILTNLKYNMHYYNLVVYNVSILYGLVKIQSDRLTIASYSGSASSYSVSTTSTPQQNITPLSTDITNITENIKNISDIFKKPGDYLKVTNDINDTSAKNTNTSDIFYKNQQDLNDTINEYNGELEKFNNISFYYKLVIAFAILLILIIIIIFGTNSIDKNSKISVYVIIITMVIIAFIIYKQYSDVREGFTFVYDKVSTAADGTNFTGTPITAGTINSYKIAMAKYIDNLTLSLTNNNISNNITSSLTYIKKISVVKNEKAELYKIKKMNLMNAIEILKKKSSYYYYIIIFIAFSIIIFTFGLILFLISPSMIMQIVILCIIPFIILVYVISYNIQKSTRLAENKNYWANYNPSSTTLKDL